MTKSSVDITHQVFGRAQDFTRKLYQCCENYVDTTTDRDPWHDTSEEIISIMYCWLFENEKIFSDTPFPVVCNLINSHTIHFFTLDLSRCSELFVRRYQNLAKCELKMLDDHKATVIGDLRIVFDLTCTGELIGDGVEY